MITGIDSREYWRAVFAAGGSTTIPRWTRAPQCGVAEQLVAIPGDLESRIGRLADELQISVASIMLAAHAKVLAALSGERDVVVGVVAHERGEPLPCRISTEASSWRGLLSDVHLKGLELAAHAEPSLADLRRELRLTPPSFETMFTVTSVGEDIPDEVTLWIEARPRGGALKLGYRRDRLEHDAVDRIAGYHLAALEQMASDVGAVHGRQSLLSADERQFQIEGLAGPRRELPDQRFHELFEKRVHAHPDAVAAVHRGQEWTYRELNAHANRLGRALLARGLNREDVVAVVTERNLEWMAAVIAVFKAGGVYLPIEPHFPADRIASMLSRAACRIVVTETGSTATLERALGTLTDVQAVFVGAVAEEAHAEDDLGVDVTRDQLAYIYFTSGSTGEPKGAMCEHAGMLNHLFAKIIDIGIGEGDVVAQVAPQCFDISLWQLVAALLVGGRTVLVEQEAILDVARFVDRIADGGVAVLQVVPSYLDVLLAYLAQNPRELPALRCVSVTGEAVTKELTERWFAAKPHISLVNAYGLTETSDDTNHEVMAHAPDGKNVPLGRPIHNVHVYVVDEHFSPVPLGAPGEIVFSGVCVGRGYINDAERTQLVFLTDPLREGQRIYRSGDFGRWRPDGKLEFLGRRDAQVKIRGFRIEIGDIENSLTRAPGVRQGAVVVARQGNENKQLVAFYSGQRVEPDNLRDWLSQSLPEYMIPAAFHWRETLPLTANGKVDRKSLAALTLAMDSAGKSESATTPAEIRLADAWSEVLGIPRQQIRRRDHFFDRGGTSLSAVKLVIALKSAVSLKEVIGQPVLAELAIVLERKLLKQPELISSQSRANGDSHHVA